MPSLLVRLRQRAISQSTTASHHSATPSPHLDPSASSPELPVIRTRNPVTPFLARKIVPDISGLLDSYSSDTESSPGLRPPRPRKRSIVDTSQGTQDEHDAKQRNPEAESASEVGLGPRGPTPEAGPSGQSVPRDPPVQRPTRSRLARFAPQLPTGGWSTFGRNKEQGAHQTAHYSPPPSANQSRKASVESAGPRRQTSTKTRRSSRFGSISSFQRYANRSFVSVNAQPTQSNPATISRSSSAKYSNDDHDPAHQPPSPPLTSSSRQNSTKKSSITHSSHSAHNRSAIPPSPDIKSSGIDSPRTFGALTPPVPSTSFGPAAPPFPPLPPLTNPELISALSNRSLSRSFTLTHAAPNFTTSTPRKWNPTVHGKTYPPRRRRKVVHLIQDENSLPFPSHGPTRRTLRGFSSLPRVRELFALSSNSQEPAPLRARTISSGDSSRRRTKTTSSRRSSAEWSAHQAGVGVTSPVPNEFGWPAEVAQEILRLALREGGATSSSTVAEGGLAGGRTGDVRGVAEVPRGVHALGALTRDPSFPPFHPAPAHLSLSPSSAALPKVNEQNDRLNTSGHSGLPYRRGDSSVIAEAGSVVEGDTEEMLTTRSGDVRTKHSSNRSSSPRRVSTMPKSAGPHTPRRGILTSTTQPPQGGPEAGPSTPLLQYSLPSPSSHMRSSSTRRNRSSSEPALSSVLESPVTPTKCKRKAEDVVDITPPDSKVGHRATFLIPENGRRTQSQSESSRAPSSYHRKRARLSTSSPNPSPSRSGSSLKATIPGAWSSRTSVPPLPLDRVASRATSTRSTQQAPSTPPTISSQFHHSQHLQASPSPRDRRQSASELSIPISALIAPHAPSVSRSSTYRMRDPRRPPPVRPTSWGLHLKTEDEDASVMHAWLFFLGFILFPLWWYASFAAIPRTRRVGGTDTEKAVTIDDPQVEHDAGSWRFRCRIMAAVSFLTYIPFIVLVAVFTTR